MKPCRAKATLTTMPAHKKPTPEKFCEHCGKQLERKRLPNGDLEYLIHFNRRRFCNLICSAKAQIGQQKAEVKWTTAHHHARRICPPGPCVKCGKPDAEHIDGKCPEATKVEEKVENKDAGKDKEEKKDLREFYRDCVGRKIEILRGDDVKKFKEMEWI